MEDEDVNEVGRECDETRTSILSGLYYLRPYLTAYTDVEICDSRKVKFC